MHHPHRDLRLSATSPADRPAIEKILRRTALFREGEIAVALEVLDVYLDQKDQEDYRFTTALMDGVPVGYVCYGPNTMTEGTWELYWIAVDPDHQGEGLGSLLMDALEEDASGKGGRMIAVETSSRPDYLPTVSFYRHRGYRLEATVKNYYAPGDDKLIFVRIFPGHSGEVA